MLKTHLICCWSVNILPSLTYYGDEGASCPGCHITQQFSAQSNIPVDTLAPERSWSPWDSSPQNQFHLRSWVT